MIKSHRPYHEIYEKDSDIVNIAVPFYNKMIRRSLGPIFKYKYTQSII